MQAAAEHASSAALHLGKILGAVRASDDGILGNDGIWEIYGSGGD